MNHNTALTSCYLRALEPEDIDFLYHLENEEELWEVSQTQLPFSKYLLLSYIQNATQDIYEAHQYRFVICDNDNHPVGLIDLYDFDPKNKRASVGVALLKEAREKGYASEALQLLMQHSQTYLDLHQLVAYIPNDNQASIKLFEKTGFAKSALLKDWIYFKGSYKDVLIYQYIF
ncbi:diamine N-acetyltransferase [Capnocytophaga haemolytica]|uniref:Acetyltransferase n=1 Tax=Capnocytophaga haemolytica TaxID=45243 RepID=A0AAX2GW05_9FLAO|nr:GNAT family N-acetyltransferase [Capnocytophaga haemolytica]AMD85036.1 acetyltransferase [Capnocytophaga haemolytica]SFO25125.1 diamine N-acetyltransferase [Capnocytophaga haemolytica]SNV05639.1 Spermidine N(1)-acetyltransferase [Capnocytophaga haemolytica]